MGCFDFLYIFFKKKEIKKEDEEEMNYIIPQDKVLIQEIRRKKGIFQKINYIIDFECPICLEKMENNDSVCYKTCSAGHCFHNICLMKWNKTSNKCPICLIEKPPNITNDVILRIYQIDQLLYRLEYRFVQSDTYRISFLPYNDIGTLLLKGYIKAFKKHLTWNVNNYGLLDWRIYHEDYPGNVYLENVIDAVFEDIISFNLLESMDIFQLENLIKEYKENKNKPRNEVPNTDIDYPGSNTDINEQKENTNIATSISLGNLVYL